MKTNYPPLPSNLRLVTIERFLSVLAFATLLMLLQAGSDASTPASAAPEALSDHARVVKALRSSPVMFIENVGQFDDRARFQVRGAMGTMWLAEDAIWVTLVERAHVDTLERFDLERANRQREDEQLRGVNLKLSFPGANPHPRIEPFDRLGTVVSYFIGNDPDQWHPDVPVWGGVRYVDIYPGIDLELASQNGHWTWLLACRANCQFAPQDVRLRVEGADDLALDGQHLRLTTTVGEFRLPLPAANFALQVDGITTDSREITFNVQRLTPIQAADYPAVGRRRSAVVPQDNPDDLLYSTFLGGSSTDWGLGIGVDGNGAAYVTGWTDSANFPTTAGAFDTSYNGGYYGDAFVVKLNTSGTALAYATFLGGGGWDCWHPWACAIAVDGDGAAYVTGWTTSADFPTTAGAFDTSYNGGYFDAFVVKLNASGTALAYATFLGGGYYDKSYAIGVDGNGAAYVTGVTHSADFPTTAGAFDTSYIWRRLRRRLRSKTEHQRHSPGIRYLPGWEWPGRGL